MSKQYREQRFKRWFYTETAGSLRDCQRAYVELAFKQAAQYIDNDYLDEAEEYAFFELRDELLRSAKVAKAMQAEARYLQITETLRDFTIAHYTGTQPPANIESLFTDYTLRALVVLSKPIQTILDLPPLLPLR
jgi:hypothetical protein